MQQSACAHGDPLISEVRTPQVGNSKNVLHAQVAVTALDALLNAAACDSAAFKVAAVVTQPPRKSGRGAKVATPCPVHQAALDAGFAADRLLTPVKASEVRNQRARRVLEIGLTAGLHKRQSAS